MWYLSDSSFQNADQVKSLDLYSNKVSFGRLFDNSISQFTIFYYGLNDFENKSALSPIENNVERVLTNENYNSSTFCGFSVYKVLGANMACLYKQIEYSRNQDNSLFQSILKSFINTLVILTNK